LNMRGFSDILGNETTVKSLQNAIAFGRVPNSAAFCGGRGSGKKTLAYAYAKVLLCENSGGSPDACGVCYSCHAFDGGNHPNLMVIRPEGAKSVGVEAVRNAVRDVSLRPLKSARKAYIFEDAETMTAAAQNALLKSLEQPPAYAVFILLSRSAEALLPTVRSRCALYKTQPLSEASVRKRLAELGVAENEAALYAAYSRGSVGRALELSRDAVFQDMSRRIPEMIAGLAEADLAQAFALAKDFEAWKDRAQEALSIAAMWYRDVLAYKARGDSVLTDGSADTPEARARGQGTDSLIAQLCAVEQAEARLRSNANFQLTMEMMFLNLIQAAG